MGSGKLKYFSAAISSAVVWGFFPIFLRNLKGYPAEQILHYRIFTSLVIIWAFIALFRKDKIREDILYLQNESGKKKRKLFWLTILAGILITGNWFSYIYAVNNISLKSAAFAYMVCPLITALGGFFILKENLTNFKFAAIAIAVISILILAKGAFGEVLWSVFIAALYAFYLIIQRVVKTIDRFNLLGVQLLISTVLIMPLFIYTDTATFPSGLMFWANIIMIAIVFTILPLFLSLYALIGLPSSTLGIVIYVNPIVAFSVAFFYFHEGITMHQVMAYSLLFIAVIIFNLDIILPNIYKTTAGTNSRN
ncbi:MAG TPA: permease [Sphingobacteriaceae bacterium]|nr:permease [Sphingobacteriaceae bacterium]